MNSFHMKILNKILNNEIQFKSSSNREYYIKKEKDNSNFTAVTLHTTIQ